MADWHVLRVGAGGFVTGIQIANDGCRFVRTDTYGAYILPPGAGVWEQVVSITSMPVGVVGELAGGRLVGGEGVYEAVIAPNNSNILYIAYLNNVFVSVNRGASWTITNCGPFSLMPDGVSSSINPNTGSRMYGPHMAIDPQNADHVYMGTPLNGLRRSVNRGATWTTVAGVLNPIDNTGMAIAFDPSSAVVGGLKQTIYVCSPGRGVYRSTNGGTSFTLMPASPVDFVHLYCFQDGIPYVTSVAAQLGPWHYTGGVWSILDSGVTNTWQCVLVDPTDFNRIIICQDAGYLNQSLDGGATWTGTYFYHFPDTSGEIVADDVPWLENWTHPPTLYTGYMSIGNMMFDPSQVNTQWVSCGTGVFYGNLPSTYIGYTWTSVNRGIEQLVANMVIKAPGVPPIIACWDRELYVGENLNTYKSAYYPDMPTGLSHGWCVDYSPTDPTFLVGLVNYFGSELSCYSSDAGTTWTQFASEPAFIADGKISGCIACGSNTNFVWVGSNNCPIPYYTTNGGVSWSPCNFPGMSPSTIGETGWGAYYYLSRRVICADKVTPNTFYAYNNGIGYSAGIAGVYRSTDGGANWTRVKAGFFTSFEIDFWNGKLRSVPGKAGHLFWSGGDASGGILGQFFRSMNGGSTWSVVPNVMEVLCFGFGKTPTGGSFPSVFIAGWVSGVYGLWRSDDNCVSWINIGTYPMGSVDFVNWIEGDVDIEGQCYICFGGSGYMFYGNSPSWFVPV